MGMERMLLLLEEVGVSPAAPAPDAYAIVPSAEGLPQVMVALEALREAGVSIVLHPGQSSMKSQFKRADASGAAFALIFGPDELAEGMVTIKSLRDGTGAQVKQPLDQPSLWAHSLQSEA
jgi:histidyl-tRNA synthetase